MADCAVSSCRDSSSTVSSSEGVRSMSAVAVDANCMSAGAFWSWCSLGAGSFVDSAIVRLNRSFYGGGKSRREFEAQDSLRVADGNVLIRDPGEPSAPARRLPSLSAIDIMLEHMGKQLRPSAEGATDVIAANFW